MSVAVRIAIDFTGDGSFEFIPDSHILSCPIVNHKEATGGYVTSGELVLDNTTNVYNPCIDTRLVPYVQVQVFYCLENTEDPIKRFTLYVDDKGFILGATGNDERTCTVNLVDYSYFLKKTDVNKDWKQKQKAKHCVICDKSRPAESIVHIICANANLTESDIDCSYLPMTLDYVEFTGSVWEELSLLANAYNVHLECGYGAIVSFSRSKYDDTFIEENETPSTLTEYDVTDFKQYEDLEHYKNVIRMKWTQYAFINERVKLWEYKDFPVLYDGTTELFPFGENTRDIEKYANYSANYSYKDTEGRDYTVVAAEDIYTQEEFESSIVTVGATLIVQNYNTTLHEDKALVQLTSTEPTQLKRCEIWGKPIIANTNYSHFIENASSVATYGKNVLNVTNKYLSTSLYGEMPFYEKWAIDLLQALSTLKRKISIKTHKALIDLRAGKTIEIDLTTMCGCGREIIIESTTFDYKCDEPFEITISGGIIG